MKKYFVFKDYSGEIFMVDVKSIEMNKNVALKDGNDIIFYIDIIFGNFVEVVKYDPYSKNFCNEIEMLPNGGFKLIKYKIEEDGSKKIRETIELDHKLIQNTKKNEKAFIEFEDDDSARLWIEAMKSEYCEGGNW